MAEHRVPPSIGEDRYEEVRFWRARPTAIVGRARELGERRAGADKTIAREAGVATGLPTSQVSVIGPWIS